MTHNAQGQPQVHEGVDATLACLRTIEAKLSQFHTDLRHFLNATQCTIVKRFFQQRSRLICKERTTVANGTIATASTTTTVIFVSTSDAQGNKVDHGCLRCDRSGFSDLRKTLSTKTLRTQPCPCQQEQASLMRTGMRTTSLHLPNQVTMIMNPLRHRQDRSHGETDGPFLMRRAFRFNQGREHLYQFNTISSHDRI